jgi:hypothetical protein
MSTAVLLVRGGRISSAQARRRVHGQPGRDGRELHRRRWPRPAPHPARSRARRGWPRAQKRASARPARAARPRRSAAAAGQPRHHRRADGPLQVDHGVVLAGPERRAQSLEFMEGLAAEGGFAPLLGGRQNAGGRREAERVLAVPRPVLPSAASSARQRGSTTQSITQSGWACRSAVTAGRACRMSPMAPSRTTSKRKLECVCKL